MDRWYRHLYQPGIPLGNNGRRVTCSNEHVALSRKAAAEGAVLLKNEDRLLPLTDCTIAVFGKGVADYVKGGGGSGDVTVPYSVSLLDGLEAFRRNGRFKLVDSLVSYYGNYVAEEYGKGVEPGLVVEPEFPWAIAEEAAGIADVALIAISRFSGENWDRFSDGSPVFSTEEGTERLLKKEAEIFEHGDFYLSNEEKTMVESVLALFEKVIVVLNTGGMVDVSWIAFESRIKSAIQAFQGGIEGGYAIASILAGETNPCGRLTDTYAYDLSDYPSTRSFHESLDYVEYEEDIFVGYRYFNTIPGARSRVVYPFGYGLSYTSFRISEISSSFDGKNVSVAFRIKNIGCYGGRDVIELFVRLPKGRLDKPSLVLAAFAKTGQLLPGEESTMDISFPLDIVSSYDDEGAIKEASWILGKGAYDIVVTDDAIRFIEASCQVFLKDDLIVSSLDHHLVPSALHRRLQGDGEFRTARNVRQKRLEPVFARQDISILEGVEPVQRPHARVLNDLQTKKRKSLFSEVAAERVSLDEFISLLPEDVLVDITGGQPNTGVANTFGIGNQLDYGIPDVMTADGPAGLRIVPGRGIYATAWPCATLLASTWDVDLVEMIGKAGGDEIKENNIGIWLAPAVNIHRSPLCGRNFEYYSEDPVLAGKIGAAMVRGIQHGGIGACVKHFALNNKETNRKDSDSRASERAIREIYLKQFEIIVREADPVAIMSSYNMINGCRASECKELLTDILRNEWGYKGLVMSDWWTHGEHYLELLAGNDLKMANGYPERVKKALNLKAITVDDLRRNVRNILSVILRLD